MLVRDYMEREGLTDELLAQRLGREVRGVRGMKNREMPRGWCEQLGVDFDVQAAASERERYTGGARPKREADDQAPRPHDESAVQEQKPRPGELAPIGDLSAAQERIAALYGGVGYALSERSGNPGYSAVTDDQAPHIARAWVKAAEENELARRFVTMMNAGGATGDLVMAHAMLVMGLAYVSGRSDFDPLGTYARKYGQFRPVVHVPGHDDSRSAAEDGTGDGHADSHAAVG